MSFSLTSTATIPGEDTHFVYSPVDMVYAQALSADDRIDWFLEQDMPRRALQIANEHHRDLTRHSPKVLPKSLLNLSSLLFSLYHSS